MYRYIISYDQHRDKDYTPIWTLLRSWGAVRLLESVWLLASNYQPGQLREAIRLHTRNEESLVVIELQAGAAWSAYAAPPEGTRWLSSHLQAYAA
jgi:hypothetical protein